MNYNHTPIGSKLDMLGPETIGVLTDTLSRGSTAAAHTSTASRFTRLLLCVLRTPAVTERPEASNLVYPVRKRGVNLSHYRPPPEARGYRTDNEGLRGGGGYYIGTASVVPGVVGVVSHELTLGVC